MGTDAASKGASSTLLLVLSEALVAVGDNVQSEVSSERDKYMGVFSPLILLHQLLT